jgi:ABC-2 type transport system ATP-binding protein
MPGDLSAADAVVEVAGLGKRFESVLAVDDLSFAVRRGEVCGLLGPNGAGKSTTLRMLLGLVRPTAGEARLFGRPVTAGARELHRVGAIIESAAFVPHLSGIVNLRLWWEAGGDRWADADVDGALAVAGLGPAVERKVKTYSHGMRQRLGIARALLGRPELMVLDEPTTGLDPQEIREVRELLLRLGEEGVTVLLSSHLLAEVEQSCSHVVVMDRGRFVAAGTVADIVGPVANTAYFEVDDRARATEVLRRHEGVAKVEDDGRGLAVDLAAGVSGDRAPTRADLVAALVTAGIEVHTVTARRRLEDAFLQLVGEEHARMDPNEAPR